MALPLLAFLGLGLGAKFGLDKYGEVTDRRLRKEYLDNVIRAMGTSPQPLFQGQGPMRQGAAGMSQGTGLLSEDSAERMKGALTIAGQPGYKGVGGNMSLNVLQNRIKAMNDRNFISSLPPQLASMVPNYGNTVATGIVQGMQPPPSTTAMKNAKALGLKAGTKEYNAFIRESELGSQAGPGGPFPGSGVQASALNIYHKLSRKDNLTEDEQSRLDLAEWQLQQPRQQFDPASGQMITIKPPPLPGTTPGTFTANAPGKAPGTVDKQLKFTKGSRDYVAAQKEVQTYGRATNNIKRMMKLIQKHGTEAYGPISAQMATIYGQITADIAALRDMGVLQAGELENIQGQIPDPSKVKSVFAKKETLTSAYKELEQLFNTKLQDSLKIYKPMGLDYEEDPAPKSGYLMYDPITGEIN